MDKNKLTIICICLYIGLSINNTQALGSRPSNVGWYNSDTSYNLIAVFRVTIGLDPRSAPPKAWQNQHMQDPEFRIRPSNDAKAQQTQQEQHEPETTTSDDAKAQQTVISDTIKEQQIQQEQQAIPRDAALDRSIVRLVQAETDESRQTALENEKLMACSRFHAAVLLPNGKVLVVGGQQEASGDYHGASCRLYDINTKTWSFTGSLNIPRSNSIAILLLNGKVLVIGGIKANKSCEVYDPGTETWTPTGNLNISREFYHMATLLPDGRVLVIGGSEKAKSCEIYDPKTGTWEITGNLNHSAKGFFSALTPLPDGRVLVTSSTPYDGIVCEVYNPATEAWTITAMMRLPKRIRILCKTVLLPSGKVLMTGGGAIGYKVCDIEAKTWTDTRNVPTARKEYVVILLPCGKVLVAGGKGQDDIILKSCKIYDPKTEVWTRAGNLSFPRAGHTATLLPDGQVLIIGGIMCNTQGSFVSCEIYYPEKPELQSRLERGQQDYQKNARCIIRRQKIEHLIQFLCQITNDSVNAMEVKK